MFATYLNSSNREHLWLQIGCATAQIGDPSGRNKDREEEIVEVVRERAFHIRRNIEKVFSNHEKYIWNKIPNVSPLLPIR